MRSALKLLAAVIVLRAATLTVPIFIHDEACIAVQAQTLLAGGHLYRDTADRKPPLVPYLYAAAFALRGRADMIAVHGLAILVVWLTTLVMWKEAGLTAAWLYLAASTSFLPIDVMGANFELFMLLPSTAAMLVARRRDLGAAALAGVLVALAALCKQTAMVMLLPVAFRLKGPARIAAMLVACTLTLAGAALYLGPRDLYFWTVAGNGGYLSAGGIFDYIVPRMLGMTGAFAGATLALWWLVARAFRHRRAQLDWWMWLGANLIAVAAGLRFFGHYYLHLLPAGSALAAGELEQLSGRGRTMAVGYTAVAALVFAILGFWGRQIHGLPDYRPLADEVRRRTAPSERVAIWGNYPEVLWASERQSAVRFVHSNFVTGFSTGRPAGRQTAQWATPGAWDMLFADLQAHPPALFIDTAPAGFRDYGHYPLADFPALADYVARNFRPAGTVDNMVIYERFPR